MRSRTRRKATRVVVSLGVVVAIGACGDDPIDPGGTPTFEIILAAGDIADCANPYDEATADLLDALPGAVLTIGDNAYNSGTAQEFADCYAPSWGRHLARTHPSAGNHDYLTANAQGYFDYFGSRAGDPSKGYYSFDLGDWHLIALNSNIDMLAGSEQLTWLARDLAVSAGECSLAYWHHPLFSSGTHGNDPRFRDAWAVLRAGGVDAVLNGHDHDYERFTPQDPDGGLDSLSGIQEFVVGTGGKALRPFGQVAANSEFRDSDYFGVLLMRLYVDRYEWEFRTVGGPVVADSGGMACR